MDISESLLRALLATVGRAAFPPEEIRKIVASANGGAKQVAAYNLCDGRTPQSEIGKKTKLDKGSLSRTITRWVDAGIVFRVGAEQLPLHIYPLSNTK